MDGHLGCSHILAAVKKAVVNIGGHLSHPISVLFKLCLLNENSGKRKAWKGRQGLRHGGLCLGCPNEGRCPWKGPHCPGASCSRSSRELHFNMQASAAVDAASFISLSLISSTRWGQKPGLMAHPQCQTSTGGKFNVCTWNWPCLVASSQRGKMWDSIQGRYVCLASRSLTVRITT